MYKVALLLCLLLSACMQAPPEDALDTLKSPRAGAEDWRDEIIYFALTDRFHNGDESNDDALDYPGAEVDLSNPLGWHGGDWAGLAQKIEEGYFRDLGVTALWISPVVLQVPAISVADGPNEDEWFAGYHGYWAEDFFETDPHFGTLQDLQGLVELAHAQGLKIIQDVVVNHAGYGSSLVAEHPDWFNSEAACAASTDPTVDCPLAGLPDFDQSNPEVTAYLNRFINYWIDVTNVDGLRIDTVKHVEDAYWRQFFAAGGPGDPRRVWSVGEIFSGDVSLIARYLDLGLPSAFDFPLYFAVKDNLSSSAGNLDAVAAIFAQDNAYSDPSRLTTFVDNHDVPRFMSEALNRGVSGTNARERLDLALSLIYTARGTPSVYYGTEIAMAGRGDPYGFPLGESNREDMDFSKLAGSSLDERLKNLADARAAYPALTHGVQQELWRPGGGASVFAFRRTLEGADPVVVVMNNGDAAVDLAALGGVPLLGTFETGERGRNGKNCSRGNSKKCFDGFTEVTGRATDLTINEAGSLVGTVPPRTLLAVSAPAGKSPKPNRDLGNVTGLAALGGDGAVRLTWTPPNDPNVAGYRIYYRAVDRKEETQVNFAPLPADTDAYVVTGLANGVLYTFRVVAVDKNGAESTKAPTATATPDADATSRVTFTVDARSQGAGELEIRRFDTGAQLVYPLTRVAGEPGFWTTTLELPLFREIAFKFGNSAPTAKNFGYEAPDQPDRRLTLNETELDYRGVYDFIAVPAPGAAVEGTVRSDGLPLAGALVESTLDPRFYYGVTFEDGSYYLPLPEGETTDLRATRAGYTPATRANITAPAAGVDFALSADLSTAYTIDGNLSEWTQPRAVLESPAAGVFGDDNNFQALLVDWDDETLYLAYRYRAAGNSVVVHVDTVPGGAVTASGFDAWRRLADFNEGIDFFVAQYEGQGLELRDVVSDTQASLVSGYVSATAGAAPAFTTEVAIPWGVLGLSGPPSTPLNFYAGVYGGDGYGAGDVAPDAPDNTIGSSAENRRAIFGTPFSVGE